MVKVRHHTGLTTTHDDLRTFAPAIPVALNTLLFSFLRKGFRYVAQDELELKAILLPQPSDSEVTGMHSLGSS